MDMLDPAAVDAALTEAGLSWERHGHELVKVQTERDFVEALALVNRVGDIAEEMDHHPDIEIKWNTVTFRLSTHSAGGITRADLELAKRIDAMPAPRD